MKIRSKADLDELQQEGWQQLRGTVPTFLVGMASCGMAAGAERVFQKAKEQIAKQGNNCRVFQTGCLGFCQVEPLVEVRLPEGDRCVYGPVFPEWMENLIESCSKGVLPDDRQIGRIQTLPAVPPLVADIACQLPDHPFYKRQIRIASRNCGQIDPESIHHAFGLGAYQALAKCLAEMTPEGVIQEIVDSGLRGRGGAGYPTGKKWLFTKEASEKRKYLICNADEGDPGAYMDRSLLEGDPHAVLEGMLIGAFATGAQRGVIYVRREYPLASRRLQIAIEDARAHGLLGEKILGANFSFDLDLVEGAGAFVSGEETALIASIEGRIAEPRPRPPYPAVQGLYDCPTVINNVETWANVPAIIQQSAHWYGQYGTEQSKGTKVFSLVGAVSNTGLVETPLGTSLATIVEQIGGGPHPGRSLKAVQTGGPSGGCIPADRFDISVDYETLEAHGSIMGSGGMVVLDDRACMVDIAKYFLRFTSSESCGKCTPCREGLDHMLQILERVATGEGENKDLDKLETMALAIKDGSLCGLGKSAPNPVLTTLRDFHQEYLAHIEEKRCPAGVCRELITYTIDEEACTGCGACLKVCPTDAISGEKELPHLLNAELCIKCASCREVCTYDAIRVV
jgi:NADH-quinone oxidoreductase subunit F